MSAVHTPGKWEYGDVLYQRDFRTFLNVVSDSQSAFVACVSADPMHRDTIFANARLIAAAPELLEALQAILLCADPEGEGTFDGARDIVGVKADGKIVLKGSFIATCLRAQRAIAKATEPTPC